MTMFTTTQTLASPGNCEQAMWHRALNLQGTGGNKQFGRGKEELPAHRCAIGDLTDSKFPDSDNESVVSGWNPRNSYYATGSKHTPSSVLLYALLGYERSIIVNQSSPLQAATSTRATTGVRRNPVGPSPVLFESTITTTSRRLRRSSRVAGPHLKIEDAFPV